MKHNLTMIFPLMERHERYNDVNSVVGMILINENKLKQFEFELELNYPYFNINKDLLHSDFNQIAYLESFLFKYFDRNSILFKLCNSLNDPHLNGFLECYFIEYEDLNRRMMYNPVLQSPIISSRFSRIEDIDNFDFFLGVIKKYFETKSLLANINFDCEISSVATVNDHKKIPYLISHLDSRVYILEFTNKITFAKISIYTLESR